MNKRLRFIYIITVLAAMAAGTTCFASTIAERLSTAIVEKYPDSKLTPVSLEGLRAPAGCEIHAMHQEQKLLGYAVVMEPRSISGPFQALIVIAPDLTVLEVDLLHYPHQRGRKVKRRSFLAQYQGKVYGDSIRLHKDIDGVSGATSSATQLSRSVRQALILVKRVQATNVK